MGALLVITGPPGAGKSTVARLVVARYDPSILVAGDAFFAFLDQGAISPWLAESHAQNTVVTEAAGAAAGRFAGDYTTVYDGVVGPWFIDEFQAAAGGVELHYVVLLPDVDTCLDRVATRADHGFTDAVATRTMHDQFTHASLDPRHVIVNDADSSAATATEVIARFEGRTLRYPG